MHKSPPRRGGEQRELPIPKQSLVSALAGEAQVTPRRRPGDSGTVTRTGHGHRGTPSRSAPAGLIRPPSRHSPWAPLCSLCLSLCLLFFYSWSVWSLWLGGLRKTDRPTCLPSDVSPQFRLSLLFSCLQQSNSAMDARSFNRCTRHAALHRHQPFQYVCTAAMHGRLVSPGSLWAATLRRVERRLTFVRPLRRNLLTSTPLRHRCSSHANPERKVKLQGFRPAAQLESRCLPALSYLNYFCRPRNV